MAQCLCDAILPCPIHDKEEPMSNLTYDYSRHVDHYDTDVTVGPLPDRAYRARAAHITRVTVELAPVVEERGQTWVDVSLLGYELTAKGTHDQRVGHGRLYGDRDAEDRYNLVREALLASLERYGIDPATVEGVPHARQTWAEYDGRTQEWYRAKYGVTQ